MKFFENAPEGDHTVGYHTRGYWVGPDRDAGFGMVLPSDLRAADSETTKYSTELGLWRSPKTKIFYALAYQPSALEWHGFRLKARSLVTAQLELAERLNEPEPDQDLASDF